MDGAAARSTKLPPALAPWQKRRILRHVSENLGLSIPIEDLADLAGLSVSYFSRRFRSSFGVAPGRYLRLSRLEHAKSLLRQTASPLCQIAVASGFSDQSHMSRAFRAIVGSTPARWRRDGELDPASD
jgi:transcriptional regulator GlxA family with amidase domain